MKNKPAAPKPAPVPSIKGILISLLMAAMPALHLNAQPAASAPVSREPRGFVKYDENRISRLPVLTLPESARKTILPPSVDNSSNPCFSGISDQAQFFSCEQHHSVIYTFGYEMNRLRGLDGKQQENFYPSHYTYNFFDNGDAWQGASYYYSIDVLKSQGQLNGTDYGPDLATVATGWPSGYDKYYHGMHNRIRDAYTIPMTTVEGQQTLKHYLFDHLDGSATGGVGLFAARSPGGNYFRNFPDSTPEGGAPVMIYFEWYATHGGTIIGYNDSVRYDINGDGKYTNDIDINGDGIVDIRDWEIGGFKIANSYGDSWGDHGYYWVLYSAMAQPYGAGGIENGNVVVLEPMQDYQPLLTMKASFRTSCRGHFRIRAGVSSDTSLGIPQHTMDFPIFNFQGGCHTAQGYDSIAGSDTIEFGLDITPLLSYVEPGQSSRFFMIVENRDSSMNFNGEILHFSFINYKNGTTAYPSLQHNIPCILNGTTYASALASPEFDKLRITTTDLPALVPGQPYQQQLQASGGNPPLTWTNGYSFSRMKTDSVFTRYPGTLPPLPNIYNPMIPLALPFSFPFAGRQYDSAWVNIYGLVSFNSSVVPHYYTTDDEMMLQNVPGIFLGFSRDFVTENGSVDSVGISLSANRAVFRWYISIVKMQGTAGNSMELILYPDGKYELRYGNFTGTQVPLNLYTGWSAGDGISYDISLLTDRSSMNSQSFMYVPASDYNTFRLSPSGLLTADHPDSCRIYTVNVMVEDADHKKDSRQFQLSSGIGLSYSPAVGWDGQLRYKVPSSLSVAVENRLPQDLK